jgi:choline dehydrogenase-like flavoprotein
MRRYRTEDEVDFVIVGSGAAGGVLAKELSVAGFSVVVLEQGPYLRPYEFVHDELHDFFGGGLIGSLRDHPHSWRQSPEDDAVPASLMPQLFYAKTVGGSSVHFAANYWRFRPVDFRERSLLGPISGSTLTDWPLTYEELEPYYTKVDWEVGVSGAPGPGDPPRSRPYPTPPMYTKSSGVLMRRGAEALGWTSAPAPVAILSRPHNGRAACVNCGYCWGHGCEVGAKSSTLASMIPVAEATGRCEIRDRSAVHRIEVDAANRVRRVLYHDRDGVEQAQRAKAVILAANGAETPRLLFLSESSRHPDGLANSSGKVGKNLMFNINTSAIGVFPEPLNEYKGIMATRVMMDFYETDPARGFYGGGGIDARSTLGHLFFAMFEGLSPDEPSWGPEFKARMARSYTRHANFSGHGTSLPMERNAITLDPELVDAWGRPAIRVTYEDHPDDLALARFLQARSRELLEDAGAEEVLVPPIGVSTVSAHFLGTCRMGDDPAESVVDRHHRSHDVANLFICDGSSLVTSGRGQPTMTIQALAFRAGEHIADFARRGEI